MEHMDLNYSETLEAYLQGTLTPAEAKEFDKAIASDPSLGAEVKLQSDIISGIQRHRALQLKANLAQVAVPAVSVGTNLMSIGASLVGAVIVGGLLFYLNSSQNFIAGEHEKLNKISEPVSISQMETEATAANENESDLRKGLKAAEAILPTEAPDAADASNVLIADAATSNRLAPFSKEDVGSTVSRLKLGKAKSGIKSEALSENELTGLGGDNPDVKQDAGNSNIKRTEIAAPTGKIIEQTEMTGKPEVVITEAENLAFMYYDNKLYLYGGFGGELYELIELYTKTGKRLYVYYLDQFFAVRYNTKQITPLEPLTDADTIAELNLLRKKRVD